jgi:hypothetical protein
MKRLTIAALAAGAGPADAAIGSSAITSSARRSDACAPPPGDIVETDPAS